jgi:hypothetical protein
MGLREEGPKPYRKHPGFIVTNQPKQRPFIQVVEQVAEQIGRIGAIRSKPLQMLDGAPPLFNAESCL